MKHALVAVCVLAMSHAACAFPLCVAVQGITEQCIYVDGKECEREAVRLGGVCQSNPGDVVRQTGSSPFCLVVDGRAAVCSYADRTSCQRDAARRNTACIAALQTPDTDPYAIRRPY